MQKIQNEKKLLDAFNPNTPEFFSKWKEYRKMMFDYRAWELTTQDLLSEDHRRWIVTTYQTVTEEIAQVAKRHGYDIVITKEQIDLDVPETKALLTQLISRKAVYASPEVDLTEEVLTNLNAEFERKGGARSIEFSRFGE